MKRVHGLCGSQNEETSDKLQNEGTGKPCSLHNTKRKMLVTCCNEESEKT